MKNIAADFIRASKGKCRVMRAAERDSNLRGRKGKRDEEKDGEMGHMVHGHRDVFFRDDTKG
jgi:hypothetical protein